jgi:diaminopimelate epimerase
MERGESLTNGCGTAKTAPRRSRALADAQNLFFGSAKPTLT